MRKVANLLNLGPGESEGPEIPKNEVIVGTAGLELVVRSVGEERGGEGSGIGDNLGGVGLEFGRGNLLEGNSDGGDGLRAKTRSVQSLRGWGGRERRTLLWGPPWQAGKTAELTRASRSASLSLRKKIRPARGPRRVLWLLVNRVRILESVRGSAGSLKFCRTHVVVVTTSQYSKGEFWTPAATRPEMWAMSERR